MATHIADVALMQPAFTTAVGAALFHVFGNGVTSDDYATAWRAFSSPGKHGPLSRLRTASAALFGLEETNPLHHAYLDALVDAVRELIIIPGQAA